MEEEQEEEGLLREQRLQASKEEMEKEEAEEGECKLSIDPTPLATTHPSPINVASVWVNQSLGNKRQTARIQTGGKTPRLSLASRNVVSTLIDREF